MVRPHGDMGILPGAPVLRRSFANGGIGIAQQPGIGLNQAAVPFRRRNAVAKARPRLREEAASMARDPFHFPTSRGCDAEQDHLGDTLAMAFGIGQCKGGSPRSAQGEPLFDVQRPTQALHVGDEVLGRVRGQIGRGIACVRLASAAAALIEKDDAVSVRVEEAPPAGRAARARAPVKNDRRLSFGIAAHFPIDPVAVSDLQHTAVVGINIGIERHAPSSTATSVKFVYGSRSSAGQAAIYDAEAQGADRRLQPCPQEQAQNCGTSIYAANAQPAARAVAATRGIQ